MRIVIAGGHGKITLLLERLLAERGNQAVGLIRNHLHATSRRCQVSSVAGVTANTSPYRRRGSAGTVRRAAAGRPAGSGLG
jgi:hypothetical protein